MEMMKILGETTEQLLAACLGLMLRLGRSTLLA